MKRNERDGRQDAGRRHEGRSKADDDSGKEKGKAASCTSKTEDEPLVRALTVTQLREAEGALVRLRLRSSRTTPTPRRRGSPTHDGDPITPIGKTRRKA